MSHEEHQRWREERLREREEQHRATRERQDERQRERQELQMRAAHEGWQRAIEERLEATQRRLQEMHDRFHGRGAVRGAARDRLIEAATILFQSRGFADVSMQEIADTVGVTKAAMYYHFRSKEELFEVVMQAMVNDFWQEIIARAQAEGPLRETLRGIAEHIVVLLQDFSLRLWEDARLHLSQEAQFRILSEHPTPEREIEALFRRAIAAGEMRPVDVEVVAEMFLAMAMSLGGQGHTPRTRQPGDTDVLIDVLLHGIEA